MLILIAESKTMARCEGAVDRGAYLTHRPVLEDEAGRIMSSLREMNAGELAERLRLSLPMVRKLQQMVYEFPNKSTGSEAIAAFTGVVFKAFDYKSLDDEDRGRACGRVRIISSLYGWLRPDDIVKPYRFDFTMPVAPDGKTLAMHHRCMVTECLIETLKSENCRDILNLLPADAARCVDWKLVEEHAKVWKADFKELQPGGTVRTPNAGRLKTLRGRLLRQIITDDIALPEQMLSLAGNGYVGPESIDDTGNLLFHAVAD